MIISKDILMKGIGKIIYNTRNKMVGRIADISENDNQTFLIISNDSLAGFGSRYFAIPLTKSFVKITDGGRMVLNIKKSDLNTANGIDFERNPIKKGKKLVHSIFELIGYHSPLKSIVKKNRI